MAGGPAAHDSGGDRGELGRFAGLVDHAEPDVAQGAGQLPGSQYLCGARVDHCGIRGLGQPLFGLSADRVAVLPGLGPCGGHKLMDEAVSAQCELAQCPAVAGDVRLAQLLAELGQVVGGVRVGSDEQVREPGRVVFRRAFTAALSLPSPASLACWASFLRAAVKSSGGNP